MCKKLMLLSCLVTLLGLSNIAFAEFEIFRVNFYCPNGVGEKGGDWIDLEVGSGCDGDRHDPRWWDDVGGTDIDIGAGDPGGYGNLISRSGDPICNTTYSNWEGACGDGLIQLIFRDLDPDTTYTVYTYHAWEDGDINSVNPVTILGADSNNIINIPQVVNTTSDATLLASLDVGVIQFTTDGVGSQVRIKFNGCVRFNAFVLYSEEAMGTAFTYQGHLYDANDAANGEYDFQFKLYLTYFGEPVQIGDDVNRPDVDVIDGYFTVVLDFNSPIAFSGFKRFLEIGVRPGEMNDPNEYTFLEPLQEVTPTPYAIYAETAGAVPEAIASAIVPKGAIIMWSGTLASIPSGWQLCDGTNGTPDLRDKFIVGAGNSYGIEDEGGENQHTLTIAEMPSHSHSVNTLAGGSVHYSGNITAILGAGGASTLSVGGNQPHENRPPYYALAFIMKL